MKELVINGKKVQVRTSFRGREWYSLPADFRRAGQAIEKGEYEGAIPFLSRVIESWEFEGDPAEAASYEGLDVLAELVPLTGEAVVAVAESAFPQAAAGS